jgi:hypothetical protein
VRGAVVGVAVVGVATLVWGAAPLYWDGLIEGGAAGPVSGFVAIAVFFGVIAGVPAGLTHRLSARRRRAVPNSLPWVPSVVLVAVSVLPWWLLGVFASRWSYADHEPLPSSRVFEVCVAFLGYLAIAYLLYVALRGPARSSTPPTTPRPSQGNR